MSEHWPTYLRERVRNLATPVGEDPVVKLSPSEVCDIAQRIKELEAEVGRLRSEEKHIIHDMLLYQKQRDDYKDRLNRLLDWLEYLCDRTIETTDPCGFNYEAYDPPTAAEIREAIAKAKEDGDG